MVLLQGEQRPDQHIPPDDQQQHIYDLKKYLPVDLFHKFHPQHNADDRGDQRYRDET